MLRIGTKASYIIWIWNKSSLEKYGVALVNDVRLRKILGMKLKTFGIVITNGQQVYFARLQVIYFGEEIITILKCFLSY